LKLINEEHREEYGAKYRPTTSENGEELIRPVPTLRSQQSPTFAQAYSFIPVKGVRKHYAYFSKKLW